MGRKIIIDKYEGNTHYSIHVIDSYGTEHYLGNIHTEEIDEIKVHPLFKNVPNYVRYQAEAIWANEVEPEENLLSNAIGRCIEIDEENGLLRGNSDGLD